MEEVTWRPSTAIRVLGCLVGIGMVVFATFAIVSTIADPRDVGAAIALAAALVTAAVGFFLFSFRTSITATSDGLVVRRMFSETQVPWHDIVDCRPGYSGLTIKRRDGSFINAGAVQKPNYAQWFHFESRADKVAAEILRRAQSTP